jgi:hypothetical protein
LQFYLAALQLLKDSLLYQGIALAMPKVLQKESLLQGLDLESRAFQQNV